MPQVREFYSDVDLKANQLFNSRLHNITTAARVALGLGLTTQSKGYMVYDTDLSTPYFWDGTAWQSAGGGTWGSITGTITAQTDLTAYLAANYYPLSSNPAGYITSAALSPYLTSATAASTYVPLTRNITINGTTYDLSADRTWTISTNPGTVTSVGLSLGTSGTDLNIGSGTSPVTGSGTIILNVPDASATARGVVTTGTQTFAGQKTFNSDLKVNSYQSMTVGRGPALNSYNIAIGYQALNVTTGNSNIGVGDQTLVLNTSGTDNTVIGTFAMSYNTTGAYNTAVGSGAGQGIDTGSRNTTVGWGAIFDPSVKNGYGNTAMGWYAGRKLAGQYNTGIGYQAFGASALMATTVTGNYNTAVGTNTGLGIAAGSYNTVIGAQTTIGAVSNYVVIADGQGNIRFKDDNTNTILPRLAGSGTRMVVAGTNGELSTQIIPSGSVLTTKGDLYTYDTADARLPIGTNTQVLTVDTSTSTGLKWATIASGGARVITPVTADVTGGTASGTDYVYLVNQTSLVTVTLPAASGNTNSYTIKKIGTGQVNIATTAGTIDGSASPITINVQYASVTLVSDGTNWFII